MSTQPAEPFVADATPKPPERRRVLRQRALLAGKLAGDDAKVTIDCVIRNFSPEGALIETSSPQLLPSELHLVHIRDGVAWDAKVIWRDGRNIGLELKERHDLRDTKEAELQSLRQVWRHMVGR